MTIKKPNAIYKRYINETTPYTEEKSGVEDKKVKKT